MPLQSLTSGAVHQRCIACGEVRILTLDQLEVSIFEEKLEAPSSAMVALPPCATCHSVEFLAGSSETAPEHPRPGSYGHLHRLLVDQLHAELLDADRVGDESRGRKPRLKRPGDEVIAQWFPRGLTIDEDLPSVAAGTAP
jgi:hypothetical protein